ncbi:MAG: chromosome segregation SMC family protein, partial [Alphaproteobacteria bacterium]
EAAGIAGLHARRHEAELRLRAAEANLSRLDDVITTLEAQHDQLKKQARQANRYRRVGEQIRRAEAVLLHLQWQAAEAAAAAAAEALEVATARVADCVGAAAGAASREAEAAEGLPEKRREEAAGGAAIQRLVSARDALDAEAARVASAQAQIEERIAQVATDTAREQGFLGDATEALERSEAETAALKDAQAREAMAERSASVVLDGARAAVAAGEADLAAATERAAAEDARRNALQRQANDLAERLARLRREQAAAAEERDRLAAATVADAAVSGAREAVVAAEADVARRRTEAEAAGAARATAETEQAAAAAVLRTAEGRRTEIAAEQSALARLLARATPEGTAAVDGMTVEPGFEAALGAALGDDLEAPVDGAGALRWTTLPPYPVPPPLPAGAEPLAARVAAPPALARRLGQIGVVGDAETGDRLAPSLWPGQRLVTRAGDFWRWDGFRAGAGAPSPAAVRLAQRNRHAELTRLLAEAETTAAAARATAGEADARRTAAAQAERAARDAQTAAIAAFAAARDRLAALERQNADTATRLSAVAARLDRIGADMAEAETAHAAAEAERAALPDPGLAREAIAGLRTRLAELRAVEMDRRATHDRLAREAADRRARLARITEEVAAWQGRAEAARRQLQVLADRGAAAQADAQALAARPGEIARDRAALLDQLTAAEARRRAAADALAEAEAVLADAQKALKAAEAAVGEAREDRVRSEAAVQQAAHARQALVTRIRERVDAAPEDLPGLAEIDGDDTLPPAEEVERRLERLVRERDGIGPVNLMAESEAAELEARIAGLTAERADLTGAIQRLRQGIGALNREGRERLLASFEQVNTHFQELFVRMFGGGRAHLALTEAEDPLEAGLEIMASPPGKKLQIMSLLSGGEQALTALSLLFAVFLTNPSPICVLDEVDAPLDDANVDRFCGLVAEIAATTGTRFMIITHHRITMARMDRLFGVTMAERGISQLVSVDLQGAERVRDGL